MNNTVCDLSTLKDWPKQQNFTLRNTQILHSNIQVHVLGQTLTNS